MSQVSDLSRTAKTDTQSVRSVQSAQSSDTQGGASMIRSQQTQSHISQPVFQQTQQTQPTQQIQQTHPTQQIQQTQPNQQIQQTQQTQQTQPTQQQTSSLVERQSTHRSVSQVSSGSPPTSPTQISGRAEAPIGSGTQQQYSAGFSFDQTGAADASHGPSEGSTGSVSGERRQGRVRKEVIRLPDQGTAQVRQVRHRLPTPEPDTIERVYMQRTGAEIVEEITEIPTTPPPQIKERTVVEPAGEPQIIKKTIRVPARGGAHAGYQQQQVQGTQYAASSGASPTGSTSNVQQVTGGYEQQAAGSYQQQAVGSYQQQAVGSYQQQPTSSFQQPAPVGYQQQAGAAYSGGFGGIPVASSSYRPFSSFPPSRQPVQHPIIFTIDGNGPRPPLGCQSAFCFYV